MIRVVLETVTCRFEGLRKYVYSVGGMA